MSEFEHVPRLDEGSDELMGQLLRAARKEVPDEQRMDALSLALLDKMGPGAPDGGPDGSDAGPDGSGGGSGADGAGGADAVGASGAEGLGRSSGAEAARTGAELAQGAQAATGAGASLAPAAAGGSMAVKATLGTLAALVVAGGVYTATRSTPTAPPPQAAAASVAAPAAAAPKAISTTEPAPVVSIDDLPKLEEPPKATASGAPAPLADTAAEPKKKRTAAEAMADLRRAQDALGSNPARVLQLIAEHRRDYPRSAFSQERDVLEIDALLRLGRRSEAIAKGEQFTKYYPKSGHRRRIDALLGR